LCKLEQNDWKSQNPRQAGYGAVLNFLTEFAGDINRKLGAKEVEWRNPTAR
jgi:hypothetical protein